MAVASAMVLNGCQQSGGANGRCQIQGTVNGEQYEGKRIFLVPMNGPATAETVDSVEIKDGKFEFAPDSMQIYKVLLDYHYRFGLQPLIIVAEPGNVWVTIDSVSHAGGTPQNDSLEQWKAYTEQYHAKMAQIIRYNQALADQGNEALTDLAKQRADSLLMAYKQYTRRLAENVTGEPLHSFLKARFPLTYKKQMPDGHVATMNADTNEEITE